MHIQWIITVKEGTNIQELTKKITLEGFKVDQVMDQIGCITGSADLKIIQKIRPFDEIVDISQNSSISLGDSDSSITW